ncbi:unnamed protein product [Cyclocybe aegerita]|uniref:Uncharacterized protein n=1 Tax=Cyclocybe aegerita TaxID=1973307 RepID=A0A8S0WB61_CYCAE|nr:unnamed protein product [Cyclocybe aegerita]
MHHRGMSQHDVRAEANENVEKREEPLDLDIGVAKDNPEEGSKVVGRAGTIVLPEIADTGVHDALRRSLLLFSASLSLHFSLPISSLLSPAGANSKLILWPLLISADVKVVCDPFVRIEHGLAETRLEGGEKEREAREAGFPSGLASPAVILTVEERERERTSEEIENRRELKLNEERGARGDRAFVFLFMGVPVASVGSRVVVILVAPLMALDAVTGVVLVRVVAEAEEAGSSDTLTIASSGNRTEKRARARFSAGVAQINGLEGAISKIAPIGADVDADVEIDTAGAEMDVVVIDSDLRRREDGLKADFTRALMVANLKCIVPGAKHGPLELREVGFVLVGRAGSDCMRDTVLQKKTAFGFSATRGKRREERRTSIMRNAF